MHILQSLFYLTIALHFSDIIITRLQEHKTTLTTASVNPYPVIDIVKCLLLKSTYRLAQSLYSIKIFNPLNAELNPICHLLALLGVQHFLHVSRIRVKSLTLRLLMSYIYIYMEHLFLMFLDHTQRRTAGRSPAEILGSNPTGGMDICLL